MKARSRPWLTIFESEQNGKTTRYAMPIRIDWVRFDRERYNSKALAAVRQASREGTLFDVATDKDFIKQLLAEVRLSDTITEHGRSLEFHASEKLAAIPMFRLNRSMPSRPNNRTAQHWLMRPSS